MFISQSTTTGRNTIFLGAFLNEERAWEQYTPYTSSGRET